MGPDPREHKDRDICRQLWIEAAEWFSSLGYFCFFLKCNRTFLDSCRNIRKNLFLYIFRFGNRLLNSLLSVPCSEYHDPSNAFQFPPRLGRATHYNRGTEIHKRIHFPTESSICELAAWPFWYDCTCLTTLCDQLFLWSRVQCDRRLRSSKHLPDSDWCGSRHYEWKAHTQVNSAVGPLCSRNGTCNTCFQAVYHSCSLILSADIKYLSSRTHSHVFLAFPKRMWQQIWAPNCACFLARRSQFAI